MNVIHADRPYVLLQGTGYALIAIVFAVLLYKEYEKLAQGERPDFARPILHTFLATLLLGQVRWLGDLLAAVALAIAHDTFAAAVDPFALLTTPLSKDQGEVGPKSFFAVLALPADLVFSAIARVLVFVSLVVKICVIDVLWRVYFSLQVLMGALALPFGLLPGGGGSLAYVRGMVQVALWPVVYACLIALMEAALNNSYADALARGQESYALTQEAAPLSGTGGAAAAMAGSLQILYNAVSALVFALLALLTPVVARGVVSSQVASSAGGFAQTASGAINAFLVQKITVALAAFGGGALGAASAAVNLSGGLGAAGPEAKATGAGEKRLDGRPG